MNEYGFLILAAGSSSRLGRPKQLLEFNSKPLLQHAIDIASEINKGSLLIVLGANAEAIEKRVSLTNVDITINKSWEEGMGSTIAHGVHRLLDLYPQLTAVIVMVCDQPLITPALLNQLIETHEEKQKLIVASAYGDSLGTPVLFERRFFNQLMQLKGNEGAKRILYQHQEEVAAIDFPDGNIDVDTAADYERLIKK
jgi:molybdenum cofactor cytidylyltransferase